MSTNNKKRRKKIMLQIILHIKKYEYFAIEKV